MISKEMLYSRYKPLVTHEGFFKDIEGLSVDLGDINFNNPVLIYSNSKRNVLIYLLLVYLSVKNNRLMDYAVITGQSLINQHFADIGDKDKDLFEKLYYTDVAFISLSEYDYTSEYLESLIIELINFRKNANRVTIVIYDILGNQVNKKKVENLGKFFKTSEFGIIDITKVTKRATVVKEPQKVDSTNVSRSKPVTVKKKEWWNMNGK